MWEERELYVLAQRGMRGRRQKSKSNQIGKFDSSSFHDDKFKWPKCVHNIGLYSIVLSSVGELSQFVGQNAVGRHAQAKFSL